MHRSVNEIAYAEGAFLLGFPISSQNWHSMRVSWALILLGITAVVPPNVQISAVIATQLRKACISQVSRSVTMRFSVFFFCAALVGCGSNHSVPINVVTNPSGN